MVKAHSSGCQMRYLSALLIVLVVALPTAASAQADIAPSGSTGASVPEPKIDTVTVDAQKLDPPVIQFLTYRLHGAGPYGKYVEVAIDIHFIARRGNATSTHYTAISSNSNLTGFQGAYPIDNSADTQKVGTLVRAGTFCNGQVSRTTSEAYVTDGDGNRSNSVRFTVHCNGLATLPYVTQQIKSDSTQNSEIAIPHTGTEAALRGYIEGWEKGEAPYDMMSAGAAKQTRTQADAIKIMLAGLGNLKSVTFKAIDDHGWDTYMVVFEHGQPIWSIAQLTVDGKIDAMSFGPSTVQSAPGSEAR
jgi:hypothetical protein